MIQRFGYFHKFSRTTERGFSTCIVMDTVKILPDAIPLDDSINDCYRVSLIDGTLVIELWKASAKKFKIELITSNFKLNQYE